MAEATTSAVHAALVRARPNFKPIDESGQNSHLKTKYAKLPDIYAAVIPALTHEGLVLSHPVEQREGVLHQVTRVTHAETSESIETAFPIPDVSGMKNPLQELGKAATYLKRYGVSGLLALGGEEDDDGESNGKGGNGRKGNPPPAPARNTPPDADVKAEVDTIVARLEGALIKSLGECPMLENSRLGMLKQQVFEDAFGVPYADRWKLYSMALPTIAEMVKGVPALIEKAVATKAEWDEVPRDPEEQHTGSE